MSKGLALDVLCVPTELIDPRQVPDQVFRYVDISSVDRVSRKITCAQQIQGADAPSRARKLIRAGDVLVSTVRPNLNTVALVPPALDGQVASTGFSVLRARPDLLNARYLFYFVCTPSFVDALTSQATGASYPAVTDGVVRAIQTTLPPLSEQNRIVAILDHADRLLRLREEADTRAERILPALFAKTFGDPSINPMEWEVNTLGSLSILGPQYGANARAAPWREGLPRYVRITDIQRDGALSSVDQCTVDLDEWEQYRLQPGDLLFARSGNTVGKTYMHRVQHGLCVFAGYLIRFRLDPSRILPEYLFAYTQSDTYRAWVGSRKRVAGQPNINAEEYRSLRLPVPPLSLQSAFVARTQRVWDLRERRVLSRNSLERLFATLLHDAFAGSLTAGWRDARMNELLEEMERQSRLLSGRDPVPAEREAVRLGFS